MKKIKVIELITGLERGGAERVVADIARLLPKDSFEVTVVSLKKEGPLAKEVREYARVVSLNASTVTMPIACIRLIRFLLQEKPDILHTHLFHADIMGRMVARLCGVKTVVTTLHNVRYGGWSREVLLRTTSFLISSAVAVSQEVACTATRKKIMPARKIQVIYNGINMERFIRGDIRRARESLGLLPEDEVLVNVGRMSEQKGHRYLLEAFARVYATHPRAKLLLAGDGPLRDSLRSRAKELGVAHAVVFLGNRDDIPTILNAADVFVFSSLWEGFALALAEAMACGKIVVSTHVAGVPEIVQDGTSGFLVEAKNSSQLAGAIERALLLPAQERALMGERASSIVHEKFSAQNMAREYQQLYERVTSGS